MQERTKLTILEKIEQSIDTSTKGTIKWLEYVQETVDEFKTFAQNKDHFLLLCNNKLRFLERIDLSGPTPKRIYGGGITYPDKFLEIYWYD